MNRDPNVSRGPGILPALLILVAAWPGAVAAAEVVSRLAVQAREDCQPARPDCSVAAALEVLAQGGTLELSAGRHRANLTLTRDVTIEGAGAGRTILDGGGTGRVLKVEAGTRAVVRGVTVTGGRLDKDLEQDGGGIWNVGELTLERSEVTGNVAVDDGGGIRNDGTLTLSESTVHGNQAPRWGSVGGGIYSPMILGTPVLKVVASTISGNTAGDNGGGIWCEGTASLVNSTVSGNSAAHTGGGIRNNGELTALNTTIAFNRAGTTGGGLRNFGVAALANSLLAGNSAGESGADCQGPLVSRGHNLLMEKAGCDFAPEAGDLLGVDPRLAPLADNGGPTLTHALPSGSPAVDAGNAGNAGNAGDPAEAGSRAGACEAVDQRGRRRPRCDIGAFESTAEVNEVKAGGRG